MKNFKFRAWDKTRKEYLSAGYVILAINKGIRPTETTFYLDCLAYPNDYKDRFIIEQSMDSYDKNGREIFSGDIVKSDWGYGSKITVVELESFIYAKHECTISDNIEIIGNVHKNIQLLQSEV